MRVVSMVEGVVVSAAAATVYRTWLQLQSSPRARIGLQSPRERVDRMEEWRNEENERRKDERIPTGRDRIIVAPFSISILV